MDNVVVIGGGISGLLAALALQKEGKNVTLFERGELGNVVRSYKVEGDSGTYTVDTGPHILTRLSDGPLSQLMEMYFDVRPSFVPHGDYYLRMRGQYRQFPWALKDVVQFDVIPPKERILLFNCIVEGIRLRDKSITVEEFLSKYTLSDEARELVDALCYFLAGAPMSEMPMLRFWDSQEYKDGTDNSIFKKTLNLLSQGSRPDQYYPTGGVQTLTDCILQSFSGEIKREEVIHMDYRRKYVSTQEKDYSYDFAVYAGMARELHTLCELPPEYGEILSRLKTTRALVVWIGTRDRLMVNMGSEIWVDTDPPCWAVSTSLYDPGLAPEGCQLIGCAFPYEGGPKEKGLQAIEQVFPDVSIDMIEYQVLQPDKAAWTKVPFPSVKTPLKDLYMVGTDTVKRSMGITRASYSVLELLDTLRREGKI